MKVPVKAKVDKARVRAIDYDLESYCASHPNSPAAIKRPHILIDHGRYVALLCGSLHRRILGFGTSVSSALHSFDDLYQRSRKKS